MYNPKLLTVIIPVIRPDLIDRCLETLYRYTDPTMFYTFIIDQTVVGLDATRLRDNYPNLMVIRTPKSDVHYTGNLGFAKATNLGISLVETPYFMMCNDDVEFVHAKWWQGVLATFDKVERETPTRPAVIVNPSSIKLPDWSVGLPAGQDHYILDYQERYDDMDWDFLVGEEHYVNQHLTIKPDTVIDGVTMYASVCHTQRFLDIGMLPEQLYPGGGEDYWYSAVANMAGYRCVGTTLSYVFHHWSMTFASIHDQINVGALIQDELKYNSTEDWGYKKDAAGAFLLDDNGEKISRHDVWGVKCELCGEMMQRSEDYDNIALCKNHWDGERYKIPESKVIPL